MTTPTQTADAAYAETQRQAQAHLTAIEALLRDHAECAKHEPLTWGHVEDITVIVTRLERILQDINDA